MCSTVQRKYAKRHCRAGFLVSEFCMIKSNDCAGAEGGVCRCPDPLQAIFYLIGKPFARRAYTEVSKTLFYLCVGMWIVFVRKGEGLETE